MSSEIRPRRALAGWMELDYFRRRRLFRGWRGLLLAAGLAGLLLVAGLAAGWGRRSFQAGPLTQAHSLFNHDCGVCHRDSFQALGRLWPGSPAVSVPDSACLACHAGSHHNGLADRAACVSCHKEHRGHDALVRVDDRHCTACHANLDPKGAPDYGTAEPYAQRVVRFGTAERDHPEFRRRHGNEMVCPDPGTIRFNHAVHLAASGVRDLDRAQLDRQREAIRRKGLDPGALRAAGKQTVLGCSDCHTLDDEGRYFQPISYERHCRSCHPLSIQVVGAWKDERQRQLAWDFARTPVRHPAAGGSPRDVRAELRERLAGYIRGSGGRVFLETAEPVRPLPDRDLPGGGLTREQHAWVNQHLKQTESVLFDGGGGCRYCHTQTVSTGATPDGLPVLARANLPARWWQHAGFSHARHRMLECGECHAAKTSKTDRDVLLPGKQTCLKCHDAGASPSARSDCIECHRYHDPKLQRQARQQGQMTIDGLRGR